MSAVASMEPPVNVMFSSVIYDVHDGLHPIAFESVPAVGITVPPVTPI